MTSFAGHILSGTTAARPAASSVPVGTIYASSTDGVIYQSSGSAWGTWLAAAGPLALNTQTTSYTLVLGDAGQLVGMNVASANNLTVPTNASVAFPVGTTVLLRQAGAGQTTVVAAGGVTVSSRGAALKLAGQYAYATLAKVATDTWELSGDITT
jgi:hypothetical protein